MRSPINSSLLMVLLLVFELSVLSKRFNFLMRTAYDFTNSSEEHLYPFPLFPSPSSSPSAAPMAVLMAWHPIFWGTELILQSCLPPFPNQVLPSTAHRCHGLIFCWHTCRSTASQNHLVSAFNSLSLQAWNPLPQSCSKPWQKLN